MNSGSFRELAKKLSNIIDIRSDIGQVQEFFNNFLIKNALASLSKKHIFLIMGVTTGLAERRLVSIRISRVYFFGICGFLHET